MRKARQVYFYSTFQTQRQFSVLYRNTSKRTIHRKNKDKVLYSENQYKIKNINKRLIYIYIYCRNIHIIESLKYIK